MCKMQNAKKKNLSLYKHSYLVEVKKLAYFYSVHMWVFEPKNYIYIYIYHKHHKATISTLFYNPTLRKEYKRGKN